MASTSQTELNRLEKGNASCRKQYPQVTQHRDKAAPKSSAILTIKSNNFKFRVLKHCMPVVLWPPNHGPFQLDLKTHLWGKKTTKQTKITTTKNTYRIDLKGLDK